MAWGKFVDNLQGDVKGRRDRGKELSVMSLPHLDDAIWGIQKRKLAIIGARPSNGKSALMRQMTLDFIMQNKNVLFFSFEETKENFIENLVSLYGMINNFDLVKGEVDTPKHNDAFNGIKNILIKEHLHIIETRGRTINDFERLVRQCNNVDCIMIDYIQLISSKGFGSERQAYDEFIKKARELAKEIGCAVIIASQINRTTIQNKQVKPPMLQELKGSGVLEEHADLVFLLHHEYFYQRQDDSKKNDYMLIVAKNKQTGRTFIHDCHFYPQYFKITEQPIESEHTFYSSEYPFND